MINKHKYMFNMGDLPCDYETNPINMIDLMETIPDVHHSAKAIEAITIEFVNFYKEEEDKAVYSKLERLFKLTTTKKCECDCGSK